MKYARVNGKFYLSPAEPFSHDQSLQDLNKHRGKDVPTYTYYHTFANINPRRGELRVHCTIGSEP